MVVDARRSNLWFDKPQKVALATGAAFSRIQVDSGPAIQVAGVDISDAFYRIGLPSEFRDLFALPGIAAKAVGVQQLDGAVVDPKQIVFPCFRAVPMGWSQALWLCQRCHEVITDSLDAIPQSLRFSDMRPIPSMQPFLHTEYVDNFIALSQEAGVVGPLAAAVGAELNKRGLATHPVEHNQQTLGWQFSETKPEVHMTPHRLWKLRLGIAELLSRGWATGKLVERLVGHITFAALLRREVLSCLQAVYVFIRKQYHVQSRLWPEVCRELRWVCSLLPLIQRDLGAPWSETVHATDASHWGRGVAKTLAAPSLIKAEARWLDRWRFNQTDERDAHCFLERGGGSHGDILDFELDNAHRCSNPIEEVDPLLLDSAWTRVESNAWERAEPIPVLEGRALVWTAQHLARSQANHGKRHLILSDSMTSILALSRGRGHSRAMNRVCRQIAAISLACGMQLSYRWIASELNPADSPSRGKPVDFCFLSSLDTFSKCHVGEKSQSWRRQAVKYYEARFRSSGVACSEPGGRLEEDRSESQAEEQRQEDAESHDSFQEARPCNSGDPSQCGEVDIPRDAACDSQPEQVVCCSMGSLHEIRQEEPVADQDLGAAGCSRSLVDRRVVLPWRRHRRSDDLHGFSSSASGGSCEDIHADEIHQGPERVQEDGARAEPRAAPLSYVMQDPALDFGEHWRSDGLPLDALDMASGRATRGSSETSMDAFGCAEQDQPLLVGSDVPVFGHRGASPAPQDWGDGRECDPGHGVPPMDESDPSEAQEPDPTRRLHLWLPPREGQQAVQHRRRLAWVSSAWNPVSIPDSAWCSFNRGVVSSEATRGCDEERTLEDPGECSKVRAGGSTGTSVRVVVGKRAGILPRSRKRFGKVPASLLWMQDAPQASLFLELFAGEAGISKAIRRVMKSKITVVPIDFLHDPDHDLERKNIQSFLLHLIQRGLVVGVWMGTPCTSWSRARRNDGKGPPPLRSDLLLWGLPDLNRKDQARVRAGNNHLKFSVRVFKLCIQLGIAVTLENPATSRLWLVSSLKRLVKSPSVHKLHTDYCQDGKPWRKRTSLMFSGVDLQPARVCSSTNGICSHSLKKHVQLCGSFNGKFLTLAAQPYPAALCRRVALAYSRAIYEFLARPYMSILGFGD